MASKKQQRIDTLTDTCRDLSLTLAGLRKENAELRAVIDRLENGPPRKPSLVDQARQRAAERGVTLPDPPPDPAVVVAQAVWASTFGMDGLGRPWWQPNASETQGNMVAAVRDLFTPEALTEAAAKVQEADHG